ncbi:hypothetical protein BRPE64_DCDS00580 (plasmid) [Caballeronia insecticola]|uniref:Uncharacterized protein n=1 Tax=Caballeronia insecticola TaxID=758793 RepID=R4WQW5_9BURK|nr:hypothetical protein BRPE64_DCDS00580 [Caballeronia insecticola]
MTGAAELIASGAPQAQRAQAFDMLAFFRLLRARFGQSSEAVVPRISDDELFRDTAMAALTMAGRHEFLAAAALLEQARGLVRS